MMSDEEWELFKEVYECVKVLCSTRVGIGHALTAAEQNQALQTLFETQYQAALNARHQFTEDKTEANLRQRIADLERELEEARAKIPRQLRVTD